MALAHPPGQIIILNGAPRSGKSSIVAVIQETFDGLWMNLGVDRFMSMTPARYLPGIALRPGGERQDIEPVILCISIIKKLERAIYLDRDSAIGWCNKIQKPQPEELRKVLRVGSSRFGHFSRRILDPFINGLEKARATSER